MAAILHLRQLHGLPRYNEQTWSLVVLGLFMYLLNTVVHEPSSVLRMECASGQTVVSPNIVIVIVIHEDNIAHIIIDFIIAVFKYII